MAATKLKIAMVLRQFSPNGGLELYALKLVHGLLEDGHTITVICEKDESGINHPQLSVHKFPPAPRKASKAERLDYYFAETSKAVSALGPFDIVHSHHFPVAPADVVTFHNHTAKRLSQVGYLWERALNESKLTFTPAYQTRHKFDGLLARQAKMRIFVGEVMKEDFYQNFSLPADAPYAVAHPGADMMQAGSAETQETDGPADGSKDGDKGGGKGGQQNQATEQTPFTFLFVGKGFRKKGLDTLLDSCRILKQKQGNFSLKVAGIRVSPSGELHNRIFNLPVKYLGFCKDMESVYRSCHAIILPSKIEPFGMAPIQGMQYGLVPIVSKVCGVAEVLTDGQDALILKNHLDKNELASLMERLMLDRELYNRLQTQAKVTAGRLNWRQTVEATEKAYETVIKAKTAGHA